MNHAPASRWCWWAWAAIAIHFLTILWLGLSRHWGYLTSINDLGMFDQAVWGTLHGEFLLNTSNVFNTPINWLGVQFSPVLLLFVPLYAIAPCPEWFTLAQSLALSGAAWPIFLLASRILNSDKAGLLWAIAYLVNPFLLNAAAWDFHPIMLAVPFIAFGMLSIEKRDRRLLFFSCLPLLFIREHLGLTVAGFGLLWGIRHYDWKTATALILLGISHILLVISLIMPALSPTGSHLMVSSGFPTLSRYGWLGKSVSDIALNLLLHPWSIARHVLFDWWGWFYLALLLIPLIGFPLAAPVYLLPALPDLMANLLSANALPRSVFSYHSVTLVPALIIAAVYGVRRISLWQSWLTGAQISGLVLITSLIMGYGLVPLPIPGAINFWAPVHFSITSDPSLPSVHAAVGDSASVSVQGNIGAHFSQRSRIYLYPAKLDDVEAVVLRLDSPTTKLFPKESTVTATLASHLQMRPAEYLASVECLLFDGSFKVALWQDPWLVFSRNTMKNATLQHEIELKLLLLRQEWGISADEYAAELKTCKK